MKITSSNNRSRVLISTQSHARRGSLYIAVIFVGALISTLALSAILAGRVRVQSHGAVADSAIARLNAHSALRLGLKEIEDNPDWRFGRTSDLWFENRSLGDGTFDLKVVDPSDGQIDDASADPVVLTGIGRSANAAHQTQITLAPLYRGYDCLTSAVHAGDDVEINGDYDTSFHNGHIISANDDVKANSYAGVNGTVEASTAVKGSYYTGTTESGVPQKTIPLTDDVLDFYLNHGTQIRLSDLPDRFPNVILNGDFETSESSWTPYAASITADTTTASTGTGSLRIHDRLNDAGGARQDVTHALHANREYEFAVDVYPTAASQQFYFHIEITSSSGSYDFHSGPFTGPANTWSTFTGSVTPTTTEIESATLIVNNASYDSSYADSYASYYGGGSSPVDFHVDNVRFREAQRVRNIDRVLLSPTHNPFGDTNPSGIYVIDVDNKKLVIRDSRIFGTLVLIDPASSTVIGDDSPLVMSAANPAYPTLLITGGNATVNPSLAGLAENLIGVNFNPLEAPYGTFGGDSDLTDTFPSTVQGLIYSEKHLTVENLTIFGAIIGNRDVIINNTFSITWDNRFYRNPPPGFSGPEQIRLLLGSAKRLAE